MSVLKGPRARRILEPRFFANEQLDEKIQAWKCVAEGAGLKKGVFGG